MMAKSHATSGAVVWLAGCDILRATGVGVSLAEAAVGTIVCAGWALAPDWDHPQATLARSGGLATETVAELFAVLSTWVYQLTQTPHDRPNHTGHRGLLHTIPWALLCGTVATVAGWLYGRWAAAVLVLGAYWISGVALIHGRRTRRGWLGFLLRVGLPLWALAQTPNYAWWLGLAVTVGCLTHLAGDLATTYGCPVLWPIPVTTTVGYRRERVGRQEHWVQVQTAQARTYRWYRVGTPRWMRFDTGDEPGCTERKVRWCLTAAAVAAGVVWLWPTAQQIIHHT